MEQEPKSEVLINVDDVALGHRTKQRRVEPGKWVWSEQPVHEPLIDDETFKRAQAVHAAKGASDERSPRRTSRGYVLHGIVRRGICGRKMQGNWNNGRPHYRCTFLSQYAAKNKVDHPKTVYIREDHLLPHLDSWLSRKFDPIALASTVRELEEAAQPDPATRDEEAAQREIADCDAELRQHRAALEAGADPALITGWMKETQAKRALAEARLSRPGRRCMTREETTTLVRTIGDLMQVIKDADPAGKAEIYSQLGLTLAYHQNEKRVEAEARPAQVMCVGTCPRGT